MTSQPNDQEPPSSMPEVERPNGTRMHNWLEAETEVLRIGDLARQLADAEEQLPRQIAQGKEAEVLRIGDLARQLVEVEDRLIRQIAEAN